MLKKKKKNHDNFKIANCVKTKHFFVFLKRILTFLLLYIGGNFNVSTSLHRGKSLVSTTLHRGKSYLTKGEILPYIGGNPSCHGDCYDCWIENQRN